MKASFFPLSKKMAAAWKNVKQQIKEKRIRKKVNTNNAMQGIMKKEDIFFQFRSIWQSTKVQHSVINNFS